MWNEIAGGAAWRIAVKDLRVERTTRVIDRERPVRERAQPVPLCAQVVRRADRCPDAPEAAGVRDRGGELHLLPRAERRQHDGDVDAEQVADRGPHGTER